MKIHQTPTVIIGAGPAGLAVAGRLRHLGQSFEVLEKSALIAPTWHTHYDRLHLHTVKEHSDLPHFPMPADYPRYVSRQQVIDYWTDYARHMNIEPRFGQEVISIKKEGIHWLTRTQTDTFSSPNVVVCTGYNRVLHRPHWPGEDQFAGPIFHSHDYRNGEMFRGQRVLIIGMGNTGAELALDLHEHGAEPTIAVRSPVNIIPRDVNGRPAQTTAILLNHLPDWITDRLSRWVQKKTIGDLSAYGLPVSPYSPTEQMRRLGKVSVIDVGTVDLIRQEKVRILPGVVRFTATGVVFSDGQTLPFDAVIVATGFRAKVENFLEKASGLLNERGYPAALWFDEPPYRGLYFLGFTLPKTGILRGIKLDSEKIVKHLRQHTPAPA